METKYASMERDSDGTWSVYNDVTGLLVAERLTYNQARARMIEMTQYYNAVEHGHNR